MARILYAGLPSPGFARGTYGTYQAFKCTYQTTSNIFFSTRSPVGESMKAGSSACRAGQAYTALATTAVEAPALWHTKHLDTLLGVISLFHD